MEKKEIFTAEPAKKKHIFLVEDEEPLRVLMTKILENANYKVTAFDTGEGFLNHLKDGSTKPDLILLDIMLPDLTGVECLQRIKSDPHLLQLFVIMLTGEKDKEIITNAYLEGATDYLLKPVSPNLLLERVEANMPIVFEDAEIYEMLSHLHQEDQNLLNGFPGLKEFTAIDTYCYPIHYKSRQLCFIFPREYKPKAFLNVDIALLKVHVRIFMKSTVRWVQIWPPRVPQEWV